LVSAATAGAHVAHAVLANAGLRVQRSASVDFCPNVQRGGFFTAAEPADANPTAAVSAHRSNETQRTFIESDPFLEDRTARP
jgi:hypothetical protein